MLPFAVGLPSSPRHEGNCKHFCRVWCIASLIGLGPILAVAVLRVNTLSPLLTSLAGSSPADGPTPFCFGTYRVNLLVCCSTLFLFLF